MSDAFTILPTLMGTGTDAFNAGSKTLFGIYDRWNQNRVNEQAQKNFETQMEFQRYLAGLQQNNFEKVFNANRIGHLTEEYSEAGLSPLLAAGMGASTAQASPVGSASTAHFNSHVNDTSDITMNNTIKTMELAYQKKLNDAEINKIDSEAELNRANADAIRGEKKDLTEAEIKQINQQINESIQKVAESIAKEHNLNANTEKTNIETQLLSNELIESNFRADTFKLIEESHGKKLSKKMEKQIWAELNAQHVENVYKTSATVKNYVQSTTELAQTIINGLNIKQSGFIGTQKLKISQQAVDNMTRTTETRYYNSQGKLEGIRTTRR